MTTYAGLASTDESQPFTSEQTMRDGMSERWAVKQLPGKRSYALTTEDLEVEIPNGQVFAYKSDAIQAANEHNASLAFDLAVEQLTNAKFRVADVVLENEAELASLADAAVVADEDVAALREILDSLKDWRKASQAVATAHQDVLRVSR